jgi:hypothetical protein
MKTVLKATGLVDGQKVWFECRVTDKGLEWFTADKLKRWVNTEIEPHQCQSASQYALLMTYPVERYGLKADWIG